jgi:acyl-CoA thioester hydrolase
VAPPLSLSDFPVVVEIPVQWGEMDAYGHVNNAVFFRYFETARIAYLIRCGFAESYTRDNIGAILHSTSCRFRQPIVFPDTLLVGARATLVEADRFTMEYRIISRSLGAVAADGTGMIVSFDYGNQRKAPIPAEVHDAIERIEAMRDLLSGG